VRDDLIRVQHDQSLNGSTLQVCHGYLLADYFQGLTPEITSDSIYSYLDRNLRVKEKASRHIVTV
jgi:UTRA domain.